MTDGWMVWGACAAVAAGARPGPALPCRRLRLPVGHVCLCCFLSGQCTAVVRTTLLCWVASPGWMDLALFPCCCVVAGAVGRRFSRREMDRRVSTLPRVRCVHVQ